MITIKEYIKEYLSTKVAKPIDKQLPTDMMPEKGATAFDWNDEAWIIDDYCYVKDKEKLNNLLRKYDESGVVEDGIDGDEFDDDDIIVGVLQKDSNHMSSIHGIRAAFLWSQDGGLYYKQ